MGGGGGGGGQITSKGDGLLRSNLPLGDSLLRGAGYFVTVQLLRQWASVHSGDLAGRQHQLHSEGICPSLFTATQAL